MIAQKVGNREVSQLSPMLGADVYKTPKTRYAQEILNATDPFAEGLPEWLKTYRQKNKPNILRGLDPIRQAEKLGIPTFFGILKMRKFDSLTQTWMDYGIISTRLVTTAGVGFIVDAFQGSVEAEAMNYHECGTGTTAENASQTALVTPCTTVLNPNSTRAVGTQGEGASANIYRTVGTLDFDGSAAVTEHGVFSAASTGVLLDRSVFSAVNVVSGDSIEFTYEITFATGS